MKSTSSASSSTTSRSKTVTLKPKSGSTQSLPAKTSPSLLTPRNLRFKAFETSSADDDLFSPPSLLDTPIPVKGNKIPRSAHVPSLKSAMDDSGLFSQSSDDDDLFDTDNSTIADPRSNPTQPSFSPLNNSSTFNLNDLFDSSNQRANYGAAYASKILTKSRKFDLGEPIITPPIEQLAQSKISLKQAASKTSPQAKNSRKSLRCNDNAHNDDGVLFGEKDGDGGLFDGDDKNDGLIQEPVNDEDVHRSDSHHHSKKDKKDKKEKKRDKTDKKNDKKEKKDKKSSKSKDTELSRKLDLMKEEHSRELAFLKEQLRELQQAQQQQLHSPPPEENTKKKSTAKTPAAPARNDIDDTKTSTSTTKSSTSAFAAPKIIIASQQPITTPSLSVDSQHEHLVDSHGMNDISSHSSSSEDSDIDSFAKLAMKLKPTLVIESKTKPSTQINDISVKITKSRKQTSKTTPSDLSKDQPPQPPPLNETLSEQSQQTAAKRKAMTTSAKDEDKCDDQISHISKKSKHKQDKEVESRKELLNKPQLGQDMMMTLASKESISKTSKSSSTSIPSKAQPIQSKIKHKDDKLKKKDSTLTFDPNALWLTRHPLLTQPFASTTSPSQSFSDLIAQKKAIYERFSDQSLQPLASLDQTGQIITQHITTLATNPCQLSLSAQHAAAHPTPKPLINTTNHTLIHQLSVNHLFGSVQGYDTFQAMKNYFEYGKYNVELFTSAVNGARGLQSSDTLLKYLSAYCPQCMLTKKSTLSALFTKYCPDGIKTVKYEAKAQEVIRKMTEQGCGHINASHNVSTYFDELQLAQRITFPATNNASNTQQDQQDGSSTNTEDAPEVIQFDEDGNILPSLLPTPPSTLSTSTNSSLTSAQTLLILSNDEEVDSAVTESAKRFQAPLGRLVCPPSYPRQTYLRPFDPTKTPRQLACQTEHTQIPHFEHVLTKMVDYPLPPGSTFKSLRATPSALNIDPDYIISPFHGARRNTHRFKLRYTKDPNFTLHAERLYKEVPFDEWDTTK